MVGVASLAVVSCFVSFIHGGVFYPCFFSIVLIGLLIYQWLRQIIFESTSLGLRTSRVKKSFELGLITFIVSEVILLLSWLWALFHRSLVPRTQVGCVWPPVGIEPVDPLGLPLLNTFFLVFSSFTATLAHYLLTKGNIKMCSEAVIVTMGLAFFLIVLQAFEYYYASFSLADGIYGSTLFIITGFHGVHVILGAVIFFVCYKRLQYSHFRRKHHVGLETAVWY